MGLAAYEAGETLEQIVADCERITSNPGLNLDPATKLPPIDGEINNAPAYRWLLDIIRNLYLEHDWHFAIQARTVSMITDRCILLPDDFWRVAYDNPLYGVIDNQKFRIRHITRPQYFSDPNSVTIGVSGQPREFYVSRPDGLIYLEPPPDRAYSYELHYFRLPGEETSVTAIPQFPHRNLLRQLLLVKYFEDQDDDRITNARQELASIWSMVRSSNYDLREDPQNLPGSFLDSQFFRSVSYED